jgi:phosphoglycolate phosphatase-like HAD superfamily hydrolase
VLIAREDAVHKPDPAPLLLACERLNLTPDEVWMVGDGRYDIEAGNAANIRTVWISMGQDRAFDEVPWRTVRDLCELGALLARVLTETP